MYKENMSVTEGGDYKEGQGINFTEISNKEVSEEELMELIDRIVNDKQIGKQEKIAKLESMYAEGFDNIEAEGKSELRNIVRKALIEHFGYEVGSKIQHHYQDKAIAEIEMKRNNERASE